MAEVSFGAFSSGFFEGTPITGTTANAFPSVGSPNISWSTIRQFLQKGVVLLNSDGANSLDYYVTFKLTDSAPELYLPSWGTSAVPLVLTSGQSAYIALDDVIVALNIYVRATVADSQATYAVYTAGNPRATHQPRRGGGVI